MIYSSDNLNAVDVQALQAANNWQAQFRLITQWGALITNKPGLRTDEYRLRGCETAAWLAHANSGETFNFYFDSDSKIICGLAAIALSATDGKTAAEIRTSNIEQTLQDAGVRKHLTPSRNNGLRAIILRIHELTRAN